MASHNTLKSVKRWNALSVLLCVSCVALELLALWVIVSTNARAQRQADAVIAAVKRAVAVEFTLQPQALYRYNQLHNGGLSIKAKAEAEAAALRAEDGATGVVVTGRLVPKLSEDTGRLRFDGHMRVRRNVTLPSPRQSSSTSSASSAASAPWNEVASGDGDDEEDLLVLKQQRGVRYSSVTAASSSIDEGAADAAKCLQPRDLPPLYTIEAASQTAFAAQSFASFGAQCKRGRPLELLFDREPFILCALDWFDALDKCVGAGSRRRHPASLFPTPAPQANTTAVMTAAESECAKTPLLVIYGERVVLETTVVFAPSKTEEEGADAGETDAMGRCELLEAPMATATLASQSVLFHLLPLRTLPRVGATSSDSQLMPLK